MNGNIYFSFSIGSRTLKRLENKSKDYRAEFYEIEINKHNDLFSVSEHSNILKVEQDDDCYGNFSFCALGYFENDEFVAVLSWIESSLLPDLDRLVKANKGGAE